MTADGTIEPQELAIEIDLSGDDLTLNERVAVEECCGGVPFEQLQSEGRSTFYRALAWVVARRSDKRVTLEEAGELRVRFNG